MPKPETSALAAALAGIDFDTSNAEIDRLDAERTALRTKADEAEVEAQRLAGEIRDWVGPDPDAMADAVMGGQSVTDTAQAAPSRDALVERRQALLSTAGTLRDRAERAGRERDEVAQSQCLAIATAAKGFVEAMAEQQRNAAKSIVEADAAMQALKWMTNAYLAPEFASARARKGLTGMDSLLGPIARLPVPSDVVSALSPLAGRCKGLRSPCPAEVGNG